MPRYLLMADRVWDGLSARAAEGLAVLVEESKIEALIPNGEIPPDVPRIDLPGCTLLPGLIDAHVHYSGVMGAAFLAAGVTTIGAGRAESGTCHLPPGSIGVSV